MARHTITLHYNDGTAIELPTIERPGVWDRNNSLYHIAGGFALGQGRAIARAAGAQGASVETDADHPYGPMEWTFGGSYDDDGVWIPDITGLLWRGAVPGAALGGVPHLDTLDGARYWQRYRTHVPRSASEGYDEQTLHNLPALPAPDRATLDRAPA